MSIRMLAVELYRSMKQVEELEKRLEILAPDAPEKGQVLDELRRAKAERERIRAMMEGAKYS
ncbi:MAG: hypothetical protein GX422_16875 [Deltaproteobacteria bacterium]|jgi:hypothetical protein|nr:hypothetical protein [Deltaproteobacteria bacterium]